MNKTTYPVPVKIMGTVTYQFRLPVPKPQPTKPLGIKVFEVTK